MKTRLRIAVLLAVFSALAFPIAASAAVKLSVSAIGPSTPSAANGGKVSLKVTVHGASTCIFSSKPVVAHFDGTVRCTSGTFKRSGKLGKDKGDSRSVELKVVAKRLKTSATAQVTVEQKGSIPPKAYLDPTFVQSSSNPFQITWCASVNDTDATSPCQVNNGENAPSTLTADPTLAPGVLDFYVGTVGSTMGLVCSTNVGPSLDYADCTTTLTATGDYSVTTEYLSGSVDSTATETSDIPAFTTATTTTVQSPITLSMSSCIASTPCKTAINSTVVDQNGNAITTFTNGVNSSWFTYQFNGTTQNAVSSPSCPISWIFRNSQLEMLWCGSDNFYTFSNPTVGSTLTINVVGEYLGTAGWAASQSATETLTVNIVS